MTPTALTAMVALWISGWIAGAVDSDPFPQRAALIDGVTEISAPGVPGAIVALRENAFPVVAARSGRTTLATVAAAEHRRGRMVGFSHGGYGDVESLDQVDTSAFMRNAIAWSAGERRARADAPIRVGLLRGEGVRGALDGPFEVRTLGGKWVDELTELDVVVAFEANLDDLQVQALVRFIERGGGLVAGITPWGWVQINRGADLRTNGMNRVAHAVGLAWTEQYVSRTGDTGFIIDATLPETLHGGRALSMLVADADGTLPLDDARRAYASESALHVVRALPEHEESVRNRLDTLLARRLATDVPAPDRPLGRDRALARVLLAHELRTMESLPPHQVRAHPSADGFPGPIPHDARRTRASVAIDLARPDWHGTGVYAVPGEIVVIDVPDELVAAGAAVRIGCHTDSLWHHDRWQRVPLIAGRWSLEAPRTTVASPFGGLVYIDVPERSRGGVGGTAEIYIGGGVVEAPRFVRGATTTEQWERLRQAPAPWAELESEKVVITVPSAAIRELDDPEALMALWDEVLDHAADLAVIPHERRRPERYVPDVQISVGYMHAGYPIMTHLDAVDDLVSVQRLRAGSWGLYHELGHNHQDPMWTFDGTVEVTVNLFSLYIGEHICGFGPREGHPALAERERMMRAYFVPDPRRPDRPNGSSWERWKNDPFLALIMYQQVQEAFGWDAYKSVFAEYQRIPQSDRPRTEQEKRDQWMVRLSRTVGHDLGPFFDLWRVPVTDEAKAQVAHLPPWMPEELAPFVDSEQ